MLLDHVKAWWQIRVHACYSDDIFFRSWESATGTAKELQSHERFGLSIPVWVLYLLIIVFFYEAVHYAVYQISDHFRVFIHWVSHPDWSKNLSQELSGNHIKLSYKTALATSIPHENHFDFQVYWKKLMNSLISISLLCVSCLRILGQRRSPVFKNCSAGVEIMETIKFSWPCRRMKWWDLRIWLNTHHFKFVNYCLWYLSAVAYYSWKPLFSFMSIIRQHFFVHLSTFVSFISIQWALHNVHVHPDQFRFISVQQNFQSSCVFGGVHLFHTFNLNFFLFEGGQTYTKAWRRSGAIRGRVERENRRCQNRSYGFKKWGYLDFSILLFFSSSNSNSLLHFY